MAKTIKSRLDDLESAQVQQLQILACESMQNPGMYRITEVGNPTPIEEGMLTLDELRTKYADRQIIRMHYVDDWRST